MNKEEMRKEFPETPQMIRDVIECEVHNQIERKESISKDGRRGQNHSGVHVTKKKTVRSIRKTALIAAAAVLAVGTTALAGGKLYEIYMEKQGNYAVKTVASVGSETGNAAETAAESAAAATEGEAAVNMESAAAATEGEAAVNMEGSATDIAAMDVKLNWLPEGMVEGNLEGKLTWHFEDTPYQGGISLFGYKLDEGEVFEVLDENIVESEKLELGEHEGVLLKRHMIEDDGLWLDKVLYIFYPEYSRVVQMFAGQDLSRDDAVKIAENITLEPLEGGEDRFADWSILKEDAVPADGNGQEDGLQEMEMKMAATAEEMKNLHEIGETVSLSVWAEDENGEFIEADEGLDVCVKEVQIADDLSLLDQDSLAENNSRWLNDLDENGKLKKNILQFVKTGDRVNTVDEIIKTEEVAQKLVYVTLEYTNATGQSLNHIFFRMDFCSICETPEGYEIFDRTKQEEGEWDTVIGTGVARGEMDYMDVQGTGQIKNYIPALAPGETAEVHTAAIVNEDELDKLYLNLDGSGAVQEFTQEALEIGYVDIRQ